jgi:transcriptional regulator with XRE-family HTH domain
MTRGDRIRNARIAAGLSQRELAEALGVKRQAVNVWENDQKSPTKLSVQMVDIARVCGVRLEALTGPAPETDTPHDAATLKRLIGRSLGAVSMLLDEHLQSVIETEAKRLAEEERLKMERRILAEGEAAADLSVPEFVELLLGRRPEPALPEHDRV